MITFYYEPALGAISPDLITKAAGAATLADLVEIFPGLTTDGLASAGIVNSDGASALGLISYAGSTGFAPKSAFANALNTLAGGGFTLYIPILGLFIANSIAGRKAMAPAAILALVLNTGTAGGFAPFFNYDTMSFLG